MKELRHARIENALWGLFIGDALAMPVHCYYDRQLLFKDFKGGIQDYQAPKPLHPESFFVGTHYFPDVLSAKSLRRPYDITHGNTTYYETSYRTDTSLPTERYHYHHGLKAGENTLGAQLVRLLLRSIIRFKAYHPEAFINDYILYLTTPEQNRDPYLESYIRGWFENYSDGTAPLSCAPSQHEHWGISSMGGLIRPLVLAMLYPNTYTAMGMALEHQQLTHRSEGISAALTTLVPLLFELLDGHNYRMALLRTAKKIYPPKITGETLHKRYHEANGPSHIDSDEMWDLHHQTRKSPLDLTYLSTQPLDEVRHRRFSTACYPEHGVPLSLYFCFTHTDLMTTLFENTNSGGDNVHRGMLIGLLLGTISEIPESFKKGLLEYEAIKTEIEAFVELI